MKVIEIGKGWLGQKGEDSITKYAVMPCQLRQAVTGQGKA